MIVARSLGVPTLQTRGFELDPKYLSYADFTQIFKIQGLYVDFSWILADLTLALPISCHFTIHRFFSELKTDRESNLRLGALHALFCWQAPFTDWPSG